MLGEENMGWYVGAMGLNLDRVGARRLRDRDRDRVLAVQERAQRVLGGAHLDTAEIAKARHRPVGIGFDDDIAELFGGFEKVIMDTS